MPAPALAALPKVGPEVSFFFESGIVLMFKVSAADCRANSRAGGSETALSEMREGVRSRKRPAQSILLDVNQDAGLPGVSQIVSWSQCAGVRWTLSAQISAKVRSCSYV